MFNTVSKLIIIFGDVFTNHKNVNSIFKYKICNLTTIYLIIIYCTAFYLYLCA